MQEHVDDSGSDLPQTPYEKARDTMKGLWRGFFGEPRPRVAVLRLTGVISPGGGRFQRTLNIAGLAPLIEQAFSTSGLAAVALVINSPGGSPVQSALIAQRIRAMAVEKNVPVIAFAEDVAASGGYMLALAGDEIFAHEASIVGSIGVISSGFGLKAVIERFGIERRLYTAGERKAMLDTFSETKEEDVARLKDIQAAIHENFKAMVRDRRGARLKGARAQIFSGDVFTGAEAVKLGLIDGIGDVRSLMRTRFGKRVRFRVIGERKPRLGALFGIGASSREAPAPADWAGGLLAAIEERLFWTRFGL